MSCEAVRGLPVIRAKFLSKKYPIYDRPSQKLLELLTLRRKQFHREFWALSDVNLEVCRGTTLGIVGVNGSGKSTLLQIIAGILLQTRGECLVEGKVAALARWVDEGGFEINWENSFAYGDGLSDIDLLERVGRPVAVYPDGGLRAMAEERGWRIIGEREPRT